MATEVVKPKFPKFVGHLRSNGLDLVTFTRILNNKGYKYSYQTVYRKVNGITFLYYEDIIIFAEVLGVDESIFFE